MDFPAIAVPNYDFLPSTLTSRIFSPNFLLFESFPPLCSRVVETCPHPLVRAAYTPQAPGPGRLSRRLGPFVPPPVIKRLTPRAVETFAFLPHDQCAVCSPAPSKRIAYHSCRPHLLFHLFAFLQSWESAVFLSARFESKIFTGPPHFIISNVTCEFPSLNPRRIDLPPNRNFYNITRTKRGHFDIAPYSHEQKYSPCLTHIAATDFKFHRASQSPLDTSPMQEKPYRGILPKHVTQVAT